MQGIICSFYEEVTLLKPHTSRPASSERYLVCKSFKGIGVSQLSKLKAAFHQLSEHEKDPDYLKNRQFAQSLVGPEQVKEDSELMKQIRKINDICTCYFLQAWRSRTRRSKRA